MYESIIRRCLFCLPAETVHHWSVRACQLAGHVPGLPAFMRARLDVSPPELNVEVAGLRFPNPLGLAAGWDKSGHAVRMLSHLGFGSIEIGSVSALPSPGNPRPRLFRLPRDRALIVNYGLPNEGAARVAERLTYQQAAVPVGVNVVTTNHGPQATTGSVEAILDDYRISVQEFAQLADYLTLNLSCPNATDGQEIFSQPGRIRQLLGNLADLDLPCPLFLKLPPSDCPRTQDRWLEEVDDYDFVRGFQFNLASGKPEWLNLTTPRPRLRRYPGAVAGPPVAEHLQRCLRQLASRLDRRRHVLIGGGGVSSAEDAWRQIQSGASLVQIYTALIYHGPGVIRRINEGLLAKVQRHGFRNLAEAVGTDLSS